MAIRAVVFDIGGVLEITPHTGWVEKWEARLHLSPGELGKRLSEGWEDGSVGKLSAEEVAQHVAKSMGIDQEQAKALMADFWQEYLGELNSELAAYFASLRPRYHTALLTNSFPGAREKEQERYHFDQMCDLLVYSHEEEFAKPDRRMFALTCERLGVQPTEMIFLDDHERPVVAARALGIHAILFRDTAQAIAAIEECLQAQAS